VTSLKSLYESRSLKGGRINPSDVIIMSPYEVQRTLVAETLAQAEIQCRDNLIVDGAQGQEAPIVIILLTMPQPDVQSVKFIAEPV
jgi:superfamily I DNA and/or RNA helicase